MKIKRHFLTRVMTFAALTLSLVLLSTCIVQKKSLRLRHGL